MKEYIWIVIFTMAMLLIASPSFANMSDPIYISTSRLAEIYGQGVAGFFGYEYSREVLLTLLNAVVETAMIALILFRKNLSDWRSLFKVFFTNIITRSFFLGTTVLSIWYWAFKVDFYFIFWYPIFNHELLYLLLLECIIMLVEFGVFYYFFRSRFAWWKLLLVTIFANLLSVGMVVFFY